MPFAAVAATALFVFLVSSAAIAIPSPDSVGSDLTILTHNDLYGPSSSRPASTIVLNTRQSYSDASANCAALGEALWSPTNISQDISFLRYLDHGKITTELGTYWVASATNPTCRTIDTHGAFHTASCDARLPVLCSNTATWSSPSSTDTSPQWQTSVRSGNNATIIGYRDKLSFHFLGLRYGTIPARFEYSQYASPSGSNVSALAYGPPCIQPGCGESTCSEACLYLNIWTPYLPLSQPSRGSKKKAVMVWIHGGGFTTGSGTDTTFDGSNMASRGDVVVVTINYRLATLGFLALSNTTIRGNYGIADQVTALDWIRAHIEDFGGDKERITVFGQSAGAASVRALLASPKAKGKFAGAIMQSNPAGAQYASTFSKYLTIWEATDLTKAILNETNCTEPDKDAQVACLRAQDPVFLVGGRNGAWTGTVARYPVVDGTYLTTDGLPLNESAPDTNVAIMIGNMRDDGAAMSKFSKSSNASQALTEQGFNAGEILRSNQFPLPQSNNRTVDIFNLTARVTTDAEFRCLGQSTAVVGSENKVFPAVYSYEFDRAYQIVEWSPNPPTCEAPKTADRSYGDTRLPYFRCHSGELYYVFGTLVRQGRPLRDEDDIPFSQYIVDTWTAFGRATDPNPALDFLNARGFSNTSAVVERSTSWKPVNAENPRSRILDSGVRDEEFRETEQCSVLDFPLDYYSHSY